MTWPSLAVILLYSSALWSPGGAEDPFETVDVANFGSRGVYGTELVLLENTYRDETSYRFEDFFWTGSGDGATDGDDYTQWESTESPTTIYKTKTVLSTVYMETTATPNNGSDTTTRCSINCEGPSTPAGNIDPTPPRNTEEPFPEDDEFLEADRQFWLLTVLKSDGKDPIIIDLKNSLARLYKTAFQRQQERHLGITKRKKRDSPKGAEKPVKVYIHNMEKQKLNGDEKIQVLYHVSVSGQPVSAFTAAKDMTLVSDEEVRTELGYPFLIKAEPYLKPAEMQSLSRTNSTWVFIGVSIVALLIILLMIALLTMALTKRKKASMPSSSPVTTGMDNRRQVFERGVGHDNSAFVHHEDSKKTNESPTYINFRNQPSNQTIRSNVFKNRPQSSISSSSSSSTSLDISPLMGLKKQRTPPKKPPRPKAAINKTAPLPVKRIAPELFDSDSSGSKRNSPDTIYAGNYDPGVVSPKSYLSMPSVRSFPRGIMPEPLNKVLEPVSVLHLDMPDSEIIGNYEPSEKYTPKPILTRHGSVGAVEDPGVIGPVVWNMHQQRLQHGVSVDEGIDDLKVPSNVSRMRKRFHDLLDDTFSLFGSRRTSPTRELKAVPIEVKSHSAANTRPDDGMQAGVRARPRTSDPRRASQASPGSNGPKGAWASTAPSPLIRPLSADPRINKCLKIADTSKFKNNDPAVPLIAAIKSEIEKCSLPGSTTDLRQ